MIARVQRASVGEEQRLDAARSADGAPLRTVAHEYVSLEEWSDPADAESVGGKPHEREVGRELLSVEIPLSKELISPPCLCDDPVS